MAACDPWTEKEMIALIESRTLAKGDAARNQCLFSLQCATGGRISELLRLTRGDVLDSLGRISRRITFTKTKNGETREVDLVNPFPTPFLRAWLTDQEKTGLCRKQTALFTSIRGQVLTRNWWYKIIVRACEERRLTGHYGTHSTRKTWARDTYKYYHARRMAGELIEPLVKLQEAGGWKTLEATRRYVAFMLGDTSAAQAALFPELKKKYGGFEK